MMDLSDDEFEFEANAWRATATLGNLRFQRARATRRRGPKARVLSLKGMYYLPPSDAVMPMRNMRQKIREHMADGYGYSVGDFNQDLMSPVPVKVPLNLTEEEFTAFVRDKFWRLANMEFTLYTVNPGRVYTPLPAGFATPQFLKSLNAHGYKGILLIKEGTVEQVHIEQLPPLALARQHHQLLAISNARVYNLMIVDSYERRRGMKALSRAEYGNTKAGNIDRNLRKPTYE